MKQQFSIKISEKITDNSGILKNYFNDVSNIKPFSSADDEYKCSLKAFNGDEAARKELAYRNLRFVISVAKQYVINGVRLADLINEGNVGLIIAASKFDPTMGYKFISYAVWYIRREITAFLSSSSRTIKLPPNKVSELSKYKRKVDYLEQTLERPIDVNDIIAEYKEYSKEDVEVLHNLMVGSNTSSLDMKVGSDDGSATLMDLIGDNSMGNTDDLVTKVSKGTLVNSLLSKLNTDDTLMINMLFGLNGYVASTLGDVGEALNLTKESIRLRRDKALNKIRLSLENK